MDYKGVIIEESLDRKEILKRLKTVSTEVELVTERMNTPWLKQWTLHTVTVPEGDAAEVAAEISDSLEAAHNWYADYRNDKRHFIIFRGKVFDIDRTKREEYEAARRYGISLGIPEHQVDFTEDVVEK